MNFIFYVLLFTLYPFIVQSQIKLEKVTPKISNLWGIATINKDEILVTQRSGNVYRLNVFNKNIIKIEGAPKVYNSGQGGLLDIAFEKENNVQRVFLCLSKVIPSNKSSTAIHSYNLKNNKLTNEKVMFISNKISSSGRHFGCRLAIKNEFIFATLGDRGARDDSQNNKNHSGSIIKILKNGNNYNNKAFKNALPEIFSVGHRNPQGLSFDLTKNILWAHEHGPQGGDELNLIQSGKNYGWPVITYGVNYIIGTKIGEGTKKKGMEQPIFTWIPSIGTSGLTFISGNTFTKWDNNLLIGGLKNGHLIRVALKENRILEYEEIFQNRFGRIRDVRIGKDGNIYLLTDESNGKLIRLSLAN